MRVMELLKTTEAFFHPHQNRKLLLATGKGDSGRTGFLPRMIGWFRLFRTLTMLLSEDFTVYRGVPRIPTMPLLSRSISVPRMQLTEETRLLMVEDWTLTVKVADRPYPFVRVILLVPTFSGGFAGWRQKQQQPKDCWRWLYDFFIATFLIQPHR